MPSAPAAPAPTRRSVSAFLLRLVPSSRAGLSAALRRLAHFWVVWSALLLLHEGGHAATAWARGLAVRRLTVGVGPTLWRGRRGGSEIVVRAIPLAGMTTLDDARPGSSGGAAGWAGEATTLAGGLAATLILAAAIALVVGARERSSGARWVWGRMLVADALVLTAFNLLPVPPLDGGRIVLGAIAAWRGAPLAGDTLFRVQVLGLALAVIPMMVWTRWTARIDALALWWRAPMPAPALAR